MSASATYSGTTTKAGRSGRGLGMAAAALAVVIAAGVVFAVNQGNEATVSNVNARINEPAFQAESDRLTGIAESLTGTFAPNYPDELARTNELGAQVQGAKDQAFVEQRLAHEFLDEQRTPAPSGEVNPLEGIAE